MGIDIALVRFFDDCAQETFIEGPMLALGSLDIQETQDDIMRLMCMKKTLDAEFVVPTQIAY